MFDRPQELREGVRQAYSAAAEAPAARHPFPVGRAFAESVGYPSELLDRLPGEAAEAFAGVSNVSLVAGIPAGTTVLDLGCGAGLDSLIAAERTGPEGRVFAVDFSPAMLARVRAATADLDQTEVIEGSGEDLPLDSASIDRALITGLFNLNPAREQLFAELARVVRPGGAVFAAELILREPLDEATRSAATWFA